MAADGTLRIRILGDNSDLGQSLDGASDMLGGFAKGAAGILAGGGLLAGGAMVAGVFEAFSRDASSDRTAAALGLSAEDAEKVGSIAGRVWADAFGENIGEVEGAVEGVISTLGDFAEIGEDGVDRLTRKALTVAEVFNLDVSQAISAAGVLLSSGLVADADEAFDLITRGMQEMPAHLREELFEASTEYGKFFADLGISGEEAFGILVAAAEDGIYGIDKAGDAIKEFTVRVVDDSATTNDALAAIGLEADVMANKILEGGDTARTAFQTIIDKLLEVEDPAARAQLAVALFGEPLNDLSVVQIPEFLGMLQSMEGSLGDVEGATDRAADTAYDNLSTRWTETLRGAQQRFFTFADDEIIPKAEEVMEAYDKDGLGGAINKMAELWEESWPEVEAWIEETVIPWVTEDFGPRVVEIFGEIGKGAAGALARGFGEWAKGIPGRFFDNATQGQRDMSQNLPWVLGGPGGSSGGRSSGGTFGGGGGNVIPMAEGGLIRARPGGTRILAGEAGEDEVVAPLSKLAGLGGVTVVAPHYFGDHDELGRAVAAAIGTAQRRAQILSGVA